MIKSLPVGLDAFVQGNKMPRVCLLSLVYLFFAVDISVGTQHVVSLLLFIGHKTEMALHGPAFNNPPSPKRSIFAVCMGRRSTTGTPVLSSSICFGGQAVTAGPFKAVPCPVS